MPMIQTHCHAKRLKAPHCCRGMGRCVMLHDYVMDDRCADAKLGQQPDDGAAENHRPPTSLYRNRERKWRRQQEDDVDRQDIQQRRAVDQQQRADDGDCRMSDVEVQQMLQRGMMAVDRECRRKGEGQQQQRDVVRIDAKGALPELAAQAAPDFPVAWRM